MSMPQNWYWRCTGGPDELCTFAGHSDHPVNGEAEVRQEAQEHVAKWPEHSCYLEYEEFLGWVRK